MILADPLGVVRRIVVVGGPHDGREMEVRFDLPGTICLPIPTMLLPADFTDESVVSTAPPVAYYVPIYTGGYPSMDDDGRYRYRYGGTR